MTKDTTAKPKIMIRFKITLLFLMDLRLFSDNEELFILKGLIELSLCSFCFLLFKNKSCPLSSLLLGLFLKIAITDINDVASPEINEKNIPILTFEKQLANTKQNRLNKKNPK